MSTNTTLAEALRRIVNTFPIPVEGVEQADRASLRIALFTAREALAAYDVEQAAKAVPAGFVLVPVEVLEDAATAIGNFVSDHGWSDEDMQAMDNLDAYIARHKANAAPATPPAPDAKSCLITGTCKHGSWCSEVYCQEHCQFVEEQAAPEARRMEPLTDEVRHRAFVNWYQSCECQMTPEAIWEQGFQAGEAAHGIGATTGEQR